MKILWFTWKDKTHPQAGGAELVNEEIAKRLARDGHEVILLVGGFDGGRKEEIVDGYKIIRVGYRFSVYFKAYQYYKKYLQGWADLVIDEVNTIPFMAKYYVKEKNILLVYQLCRKIWFYQMFFPLNLLGFLLEPVYLWFLSDRKVITESQSTKNDLVKYGFKKDNISLISVGVAIIPTKSLKMIEKYKVPTILSLSTIRNMKRTLDIIKAFEIAKKNIVDLKLVIAGDSNSKYGQLVLNYIDNSQNKKDIKYWGKVNKEKKIELMQKSHLICVTSIKEGWGLIVTEANSQGTPAVVYNVDGLRDAVKNNETGLICAQNTPQNLAKNIVKLFSDKKTYNSLQKNAWEWSKEITFEKSYEDFKQSIGLK